MWVGTPARAVWRSDFWEGVSVLGSVARAWWMERCPEVRLEQALVAAELRVLPKAWRAPVTAEPRVGMEAMRVSLRGPMRIFC